MSGLGGGTVDIVDVSLGLSIADMLVVALFAIFHPCEMPLVCGTLCNLRQSLDKKQKQAGGQAQLAVGGLGVPKKKMKITCFCKCYPNSTDYEAQLHMQETKNCTRTWWETFVAFNQEWLLGVRLRILIFGQLIKLMLYLFHYIFPQTSACLAPMSSRTIGTEATSSQAGT